MAFVRIPEPFDHPDWLFEVKYHGFRALAHVERYECRLISRRGHVFPKWDVPCGEIAHNGVALCASTRRPQPLRRLRPSRYALQGRLG
jgi:hypothetical protein